MMMPLKLLVSLELNLPEVKLLVKLLYSLKLKVKVSQVNFKNMNICLNKKLSKLSSKEVHKVLHFQMLMITCLISIMLMMFLQEEKNLVKFTPTEMNLILNISNLLLMFLTSKVLFTIKLTLCLLDLKIILEMVLNF